jgi:hypothetical protein
VDEEEPDAKINTSSLCNLEKFARLLCEEKHRSSD